MSEHDWRRKPVHENGILAAAHWLVATWYERFGSDGVDADGYLEPLEFGALEPFLAEAIVLDRGADFLFSSWGAAMSLLCGGDRFGDRLSVFPQPSRAQLRRVCVRAAASKSPAMSRATWAVDGEIWQCALLALPTAGDDLSAKRLLVALLFAPHAIFAEKADRRGLAPLLDLEPAVHQTP